MKKILNAGHLLIAAIICLLTMMVILLPVFNFAQKFQDYLVHILFFLLVLGLIGLVINNRTILFSGLGCAALLALFLKNASNSELKNPKLNDQNKITVIHINLSLVTDVTDVQNIIADSTVDVLSFQEYTPDWANILPQILQQDYPYHHQQVRIDIYGKAIFSRYPFTRLQLVNYYDIPNIEAEITINGGHFSIFSSYMTPALDNMSKVKAKNQFSILQEHIASGSKGLIVMGEFNQVYWSHDIIAFRNKTGLLNSRRVVNPSSFKMPYDHIFYARELECYRFEEIEDISGNHIGCKASFQYKVKSFRNTKI